MVCGRLPRCYSAKCKFFADDTEPDNRINWYFVPEGTPVFEGPHVFWPRYDDDDKAGLSPHENTMGGGHARKWRNGANLWGTTGDHFHGDPEDFLGNATRAKYYVGGNPPERPCGGPLRIQIKFGFKVKIRPKVWVPLEVGLAFGGEIVDSIDVLEVGLAFGAVGTSYPAGGELLAFGFEVGTTSSTMPAGGEVLASGFEVGTELISV